MADYVLSAKGTYDGSDFDSGIEQSQSKLSGFMEQARTIGAKFASLLGNGVVKAADTITSTVGTVAAGIATLAATGGISRALNLEKAEHLFDGIGLGWNSMTDKVDATTGKFMTYKDIVNDAVTDTRFSLDEAAIVAANLGAAGVKSGEQLSQALDGATGLASTFGADLLDVGGIFQKVAAQGKVTGDNIYQMSARGINALDALAKHYGVTQQEAQAMVSAGKVSFQDFSDAMSESFGGAAKTANDTFLGSLANVKAALSRIGAKFATPGLDALKNTFNALRPLINATSTALDPLVAKFTGFLGIAEDGSVQVGGAVDKLIGFINNLTDKVKSLGDGGFDNLSKGAKIAAAAIGLLAVGSMGGLISQIPIVGDALGGLFGLFGKIATPAGSLSGIIGRLGGVFGGLSAPIIAVIGVIAALVAAFGTLMVTNDDFRNTITGLVGEIGAALQPAFQSLAGLLPSLQGLFQSVMHVVEQLAPAILRLVAAIAPVVSTIISSAVPVISTLMDIIGALLEQITGFVTPIINKVASLIQKVAPQIQQIISSAMAVINQVITTIWPHIEQIITNVMNVILAVINAVWPLIETIITQAMNVIQAVIDVVSAAINGDWDAFWNAVANLARTVWEAIKAIVSSAINAVSNVISLVISAIQSFWNSAWNAISSTLDAVWSAIQSIVSSAAAAVSGAVSNLVGSVIGFFSNMGSNIVDAASNMWSSVQSAFSNGVSSAVGIVSSLPGQIMGIFSGIGSWLYESGASLIDGFVDGIRSAAASAAGAVSDTLSSLRSLFPFSPAKEGPFSGRGWVLYSGMSIMDALSEGAEKRINRTVAAYSGISERIRDALDIGESGYAYEVSENGYAPKLPDDDYGRKRIGEDGRAESGKLLEYLCREVSDLNSSLGRKIRDNAPVVTETERQAARRYRRAQYD